MWIILSFALSFLPFNFRLASLLLVLSAILGVYHAVLTLFGFAFFIVMMTMTELHRYYQSQEKHTVSTLLEIFLLISCLALFRHLVPGIHNQLVIDHIKAGPLSAPFKMYYNFDKALLPFLLFACLPSLFNVRQPDKKVGMSAWCLLGLCVPMLLLLAMALGVLKVEWHLPAWFLSFSMTNLFFVSLPEEAFFRGYLQQRLYHWLGVYPAWLLSSLVFAITHMKGDLLMVAFALAAGLIYGLAWMWSGRLWVAIAFHFALNLIHLLFFTYPVYQHG